MSYVMDITIRPMGCGAIPSYLWWTSKNPATISSHFVMGNISGSCKMSDVLRGLVGVVEATIGRCIGCTLVPCPIKILYRSGKAVEVASIQGGCGTGKSVSAPRNTRPNCRWQANDTCHSLPPMDYPCIRSLVEVLPAMPSISILQLSLLHNVGQRY